jgi:hypothetical protein
VPVERLERQHIPLEVGQRIGVVTGGLLGEPGIGVIPNPTERRAGDHVPAEDVLVATVLGQLAEGMVIDRVGHAIADVVNPKHPVGACAKGSGERGSHQQADQESALWKWRSHGTFLPGLARLGKSIRRRRGMRWHL